MLTLYLQPFCHYCERVLRFISEHDLSVHTKDISREASVATELIALGSKRQVPYLIDETAGVSMYESADIIEYLKTHYVH